MGGDFASYAGNGIDIPNGKALQLVGISNYSNNNYASADYAYFTLFGSALYRCEIGFVFSENTTVALASDAWDSAIFSFIMYDLGAQNLASIVPQQTTPTLYPNPTSSLLALNSDKEYDIEVYDMAGNKVMALTGNSIDMSHLSSATYIVKALDKVENEEVSYKVVKN